MYFYFLFLSSMTHKTIHNRPVTFFTNRGDIQFFPPENVNAYSFVFNKQLKKKNTSINDLTFKRWPKEQTNLITCLSLSFFFLPTALKKNYENNLVRKVTFFLDQRKSHRRNRLKEKRIVCKSRLRVLLSSTYLEVKSFLNWQWRLTGDIRVYRKTPVTGYK